MSRRLDSESIDGESVSSEAPAVKPANVASIQYNTSRKRKATQHVILKKHANTLNAEQPLKLVPITLDLEIDGIKIKDNFTWNLNESLTTPEQFAKILVEDIDSPTAAQLEKPIASTIRTQCQSLAAVAVEDDYENGQETAEEESQEAYDDMRIVIKLDLHVGELHLRDQFEWPLFKTNGVTPEDFARQLSAELGIGGEFISQIAHSIREQVCFARLNYDETMSAPEFARLSKVPYRNEYDEFQWQPELKELDNEELEKINKERERNARRMRRTMRTTRVAISAPQPTAPVVPAAPVAATIAAPSTPNASSFAATALAASQIAASTMAPNPFQMHPAGRFPFAFMAPLTPQAQPKIPYRNFNPTPEDLATLALVNPMFAAPGMIPNLGMSPPNPAGLTALQKAAGISPANNAGSAKKLQDPVLFAKQLELMTKVNHVQLPPLGAPGAASNSSDKTPHRRHRGFGASAKPFNEDGAIEVGEFRKNWRCSWCWLSGKYTPTLRRGPLGSKTLCNACGIWFSKHGTLPQERYQEHGETVP